MEQAIWALLVAATMAGAPQPPAPEIAWGDDPAWRIENVAPRWLLRLDGEGPLSLLPGAWQVTPQGRRMTGTIGAGRFVLVATFGSCGGAIGGGRKSSYFARLTLPDGRVLRGCMGDVVASGYPG